MSTTMFVYVQDSLLAISTAGAAVALAGGATAGIALGLRRSGLGTAALGVWATGLLLSMLSIALLTWWPVTLALLGLAAALALGLVTGGIVAIVRRPQYRRSTEHRAAAHPPRSADPARSATRTAVPVGPV